MLKDKCRLRIARPDFDVLRNHLFPGDWGEHGAVLLAGISVTAGDVTLYVREVYLAEEGTDYIEGNIGHRALTPKFIHRLITRARDERLVYLAVHNHGSDREVGFSSIDLESHERGYPALLQIARGMPVGALVLGRRSIQADLWMPDGSRRSLDCAIVIGSTIERLTPAPTKADATIGSYDRQIRMFGNAGQAKLADASVGVIGLEELEALSWNTSRDWALGILFSSTMIGWRRRTSHKSWGPRHLMLLKRLLRLKSPCVWFARATI